jgi:N-acetylglucosamine kinase-like BadF-type ATPase
MKLFLGVDGGQSGTTALVGDESGRVLAIGRAGPCNHVGAAEGRARFLSALGASLDSTGFRNSHFESACLGFSGGPDDKAALAREIVNAAKYSITHDALIALAGATGGSPGVVMIAGTGSIAFGRNAEGREARAGGWGYVFGDEGGAFDLTRQALRAVLRESEGWGPPTALRRALFESTGASGANDLLHRFYTDEYPRARVASFAKLVDEAALNGDAVAGDLIKAAAQSLASLATAVRAQLFAPDEIVRISHVGGVFRSRILLERFQLLMELDEANRVAPPEYGPAAGALLEAYRIAGIQCRLQNLPEEK